MAQQHSESLTLALASVCQCALMTSQLARQGVVTTDAFKASLLSLMSITLDPPQDPIHHDEHGLKLGLESLLCMLTNSSGKGANAEITRYTLALLTLAKRLEKKPDIQQQLQHRLSSLERQRQFYSLDSPTLLAAIAAIYSDLISPLTPRISVYGSQPLLQNSLIQNKIRSVLLSGLQSAQAWRCSGGRRLSLLLSRTKLVKCCDNILSRLS